MIVMPVYMAEKHLILNHEPLQLTDKTSNSEVPVSKSLSLRKRSRVSCLRFFPCITFKKMIWAWKSHFPVSREQHLAWLAAWGGVLSVLDVSLQQKYREREKWYDLKTSRGSMVAIVTVIETHRRKTWTDRWSTGSYNYFVAIFFQSFLCCIFFSAIRNKRSVLVKQDRRFNACT